MSLTYPIGSILPYAGPASSEGELYSLGLIPCDGRKLSKSHEEYLALFHVIGTAYGGTSTEFFVPDYRGRFLRGTDNGRGLDPDAAARKVPQPDLADKGNSGDKVGSLQECAIKKHTHSYTMCSDYHKVNYGSLIGPGVFLESDWEKVDCVKSGAKESRPKNVYVYFCIVFRQEI